MSHSRIIVRHLKTSSIGNWRTYWPVWAIGAVLLCFGVIAIVETYLDERPQKSDVAVATLGPGQDLHISLGDLSLGKLHLYEASASGKKVKFVVQRSQDNAVHVALASCSACYRSKNPHYALEGTMMCGKCRNAMDFASKGQKAAINHCMLPEIAHSVFTGSVIVLTNDVIEAAHNAFQ